MQNNGVRSFSLLTVMLVFTGISLGLAWWQDCKGLGKQIVLERQNQRIVRHDVQARILGFTMFSDEDDYVFELSKNEQELRAKLSQGEDYFICWLNFIGLWEAAIEDRKRYDWYQQQCDLNCRILSLPSEVEQQKQPAELIIATEKQASFDKFFHDSFYKR